mmetsp:Transcript_21408/g.32995  ORF Transcript_21408/g.32995 Transcript_21408/m.32995 type:complete len:894 (-) Transcript_21408:245-2926(-)
MITVQGRLIFLASLVLVYTSSCYAFTSNYPFKSSTARNFRSISRPLLTPLPNELRFSGRQYGVRAKKLQQNTDEIENPSFPAKKLIKCGTKSCKRFAAKTKAIMNKVLNWQRRSHRSLLMAAALALSAAFGSREHFDQYAGGIQTQQPDISRVRYNTQKASSKKPTNSNSFQAGASVAEYVARGGGKKAEETMLREASLETSKTIKEALVDLQKYMAGPKADTLILLLATALVTPVCKRFGTSPILGFLASGMLLGPNGCGLISGIHTTETLAELGIVFFLFEMGIELSVERLMSMRKDVFGLGLSQFLLTATAIAGVGSLFGLPANALVVLGGGLALSSSAFVLQLLKDKNQLATRFGKAAFGVLLFQDLAVVPLLVVTPILAGGGGGLARALGSATIKAAMALGSIAFCGRVLLNPLFKTVAQAQSQEAFLGMVLLTVLSMSFMTEGLGLSNTLGAFLAGVLLSETKYRYQIEADIAPFRGILLGLFFVTVGFEIDVNLIAARFPLVAGIVIGILAVKAAVLTALSMAFGLSLSTSQQTGLILSQGGEFAFVAFGLARGLGILDPATTKLLLTCVSLTMALTPLLANVGGKIAKKLEEESDFTHYLGQDRDANEIKESDDFAVVVGYGVVGKVVCDLLDRKFIKYVGLEIDPNKAIQARNRGLPVFYGDIGRPEVADAFNVGQAKAVIVCIANKDQANRAVIALRRLYPDLKIFCRAKDADHAQRLQKTLDVAAMVPILPEDNILLTLPFAGAVLKSLGAAPEEVNALLEVTRKEVLSGKSLTENEEQVAMAQLGIEKPPELKVVSNDEAEAKSTKSDAEDDDGLEENKSADEEDDFDEIIDAVIEEKSEKSPKVAEVIKQAFPDVKKEKAETKETAADADSGLEPAAVEE